jgi:hypothetical protein
MRWRLLGIIPLMAASGPDITRSSAGRLAAEYVWLPPALCGEDVLWSAPEPSHPVASLKAQGERVDLTLSVDGEGRLKSLGMPRWGNPAGGEFRYEDFGAVVEQEGSFGGYTIPTRLRVGWYFGTERFELEGEFFRVTVDDAEYK